MFYEIGLQRAQVYFYDSPNQHGAFAYLWKVPETEFRVDPDPNWYCYEVFTGDYVYTIENAPAVSASLSGSSANYGPNGEILQYVLNTPGHWLALWNNTAIPELLAGKDYYAWMWRPYGKTVDGRKGYVWNVSIPEDVKGSVVHVLEDRIIIQSGLLNLIGYGARATIEALQGLLQVGFEYVTDFQGQKVLRKRK